MRTLISIGCLILVAFASAATQSSVTGHWRAVLLLPEGGTQDISMDLTARGKRSPEPCWGSTSARGASTAAP